LDLMPEQPEMYYLLGQALAGSGRVDDARAMFSAAANLAPYRARYRKALSNLPGPLAVAP
jgi:Flp pilus assembly protein TadD